MYDQEMKAAYDKLINEYGFDEVSIQYTKKIQEGYVKGGACVESIDIFTRDRFQDDVEYNHRQSVGVKYIRMEDFLSGEWEDEYMSRGMREVSVLAAQSNQSKLIMDQLVTLQAKEFAQKLVATREELGSWITDQRGNSNANK